MTPRAIIIQTWAILAEAYRELANRKLFWITLAISAFVALAVAAVGINANGITILHWELDAPLTTATMSRESFYKNLFVTLGVQIWLAWAATILALISTASIFPDFLSGGAVDLWLSKPISRLRLFLTKYAAGLLFVTLQVSVFTVACFLVLGLRGGVWVPWIFLAIPLVVCFFSYLFAFCVLFAVLTRSTIAALLLTMLVWFGLFLVNSAEASLLTLATMPSMQMEAAQKRIEVQRSRPAPNESRIEQLESQIETARASRDRMLWWHAWALRVKTVLPKTDETIDLLERRMTELAALPRTELSDDEGPRVEGVPIGTGEPVSADELERRVEESRRSRPVWWILGTSLLFEIGVVGLAALIFSRRDF